MRAFLKYSSLCLILPSFFVSAQYSLNEDRTTDLKHGLWEIRMRAVDFLSEEAIKHHIYREALEPNLKIVVPGCSVPLRAMWKTAHEGLPKYTVSVICDKSSGVTKAKWSVNVPTIARKAH